MPHATALPQHGTPCVAFAGRLASNAEVRNRPCGPGGQMVPVLCLELEPDGTTAGHTIHAEQPFTEATRMAAEARARYLKAGTRVRVYTRPQALRLVLHDCTRVQAVHDDPADSNGATHPINPLTHSTHPTHLSATA